jgi:hypothetical protein
MRFGESQQGAEADDSPQKHLAAHGGRRTRRDYGQSDSSPRLPPRALSTDLPASRRFNSLLGPSSQ